MSNFIPNDLAIVSEYAREQMVVEPVMEQTNIKSETVDVRMTEATTVINPQAIDVNIDDLEEEEEVEVKLETLDAPASEGPASSEPAAEIKEEDSLDAAIAGKVLDYDSSDVNLSSSSDDDSGEDSDSESEDDEYEDATDKIAVCEDEDDEGPSDGIVKTAHEIVEFDIQTPTFTMTPQTTIVLAGEVFQVVDNVVVVQSRPGSEFTTLDQGSLLVSETKDIMGEVFETFGPIARPFYTIRYKSKDDIKCKVADPVFYVPDYQNTQFVQTEALKKIKGTDASNRYDEEVDEDELEFSDDEEEREHKKRIKKDKKTKRKNAAAGPRAYNSRDNMNDAPEYNQYASTIPPRQQQSYADMYEDFGSSLDAYQSQRQQQSYADIMDDFGASLDAYNSNSNQQKQQQQQQPPRPNPAAQVAAALLNNTATKSTAATTSTASQASSIFGSLPSLDDIVAKDLE